jgi:hypothetical protein
LLGAYVRLLTEFRGKYDTSPAGSPMAGSLDVNWWAPSIHGVTDIVVNNEAPARVAELSPAVFTAAASCEQ